MKYPHIKALFNNNHANYHQAYHLNKLAIIFSSLSQ